MPEVSVNVLEVSFSEHEEDIRRIRHAVFTDEQGIDANLDFDSFDPGCVHVIARHEEAGAIGTARMFADGHIGRIAVLAHCRGRGIGRKLVEGLLKIAARRELGRVYLNSQTHAVGFYQALEFEIFGEPFMEAGIEHIRMQRQLER